jgi:hypothetical protein
MTEVEINNLTHSRLAAIGEWLDQHMPNPPLPEPQRWTLGYDKDQIRLGIKFSSERDAFHFTLRWS